MRMKKTCERCKALTLRQGYGYKCDLGHRIDICNAVPQEPCEKPLTNKDLVFSLRFCRRQSGSSGL